MKIGEKNVRSFNRVRNAHGDGCIDDAGRLFNGI